MDKLDLRAELRQATADIHERLDRTVGQFDDRTSYRLYLENTFRFRHSVEPALAGHPLWPVQSLIPDLRQDLEDFGLSASVSEVAVPPLSDPAAQIGALYVLEGSGLGARLLFRRAEALGLDAQFGARHLATQIGDPNRWRRFVALLDGAEDIDRSQAVAGAHAVFETALALYAEKISERS